MTRPIRHRRRAERFAQLLDEATGGRRQRRRTPYDDELAELVELRQQLTDTTPAPDLDPEFRAGLRAMLVATADREGIGAAAQPEPPPSPHRAAVPRPLLRAAVRGPRARTAVIAGVAVGAVAFTGMSTASDDAVPGDPLYGVKRSSERAQLALASSDVGRGQLYLDFARTRRQEAQALAGEEGDLARVLADMDSDTSHGVRLLTTAADSRQDPAALEVIESFVTGQRSALRALAARVTGADAAGVRQSLALLAVVTERVADLRQSLTQECPTATSIDALGPVPAACLTLPNPGESAAPPAAPGPPEQPAPAQTPSVPPEPEREPADAPSSPGPTDGATPGDDEPATPVEGEEDPEGEDPEDDGGLLSGLNRFLGNLLGS